jgi:hypothetical protein
MSYAFSFIFLNKEEILLYIFTILFTILFILGSYFSREVERKEIYILLGIFYLLLGFVLFKNIFNIYLTFSIFFILKYFKYEHSFLSSILYFIIIYFIVLYNPILVSPLKDAIYQSVEKTITSNLKNLMMGAQYQLSNIYMSGYYEAENILYNNNDLEGLSILLKNQDNVNQTFIQYSTQSIDEYINYYNETIEKYVDNIVNSMFPEFSLILSIAFFEIFAIFMNINKKTEGL